jgi:hypothetical protein
MQAKHGHKLRKTLLGVFAIAAASVAGFAIKGDSEVLCFPTAPKHLNVGNGSFYADMPP